MSERRHHAGNGHDTLGPLIRSVLHGAPPPGGYGHFQPHEVSHPAQTVNGRSPSSPGAPRRPRRLPYPLVYGLTVLLAATVTVLALLFA